MLAARKGDLATLTRVVEEGVDLEATDDVRATPPAAPNHSALALRPRRPPPLLPRPPPPPLTACGAAAAPP